MKMMSIKTILEIALAVVAGSGLIAAVAWHHQRVEIRGVVHGTIVRDQSRSRRPGCESTAALERRAFTEPGIGPGSTVTVTVTGDASTALEPQLLSSVTVPFSRKVFERRDAATEQQTQLIREAQLQCEKLPRAAISPIYLAVKRAVEHLRGLGCRPNTAGCFVEVETDGEENADPQIRLALNGGKPRSLPAPIDNSGIKVTMCGTAETLGSATDGRGRTHQMTPIRDEQRVERLRDVWLQLFTNRDLVVLEPYCPKN
jgi:hypothetical protein